ncbi:hypothetical protein NLX86_22525 [Streptomyces sp. A3M-1-3]|uniref:hypothetical protein n=1 Tax=Streptomyces sp. A3M-1-3 TaxID=2962044 RepID=UPI0020B90267|nr:hypothetical protein [Streptomyces sp. A3M-1-3]MCP3820768.1 hypothetical protein [Streptomyces sp. A3M-1-3]
MTPSNGTWGTPVTSFVVTGEAIDSKIISEALNLAPSDLREGVGVHHGSTWWAYAYDERFSGNVEDQVGALVARFAPCVESVTELIRAGHEVHVSISGTAETGSRMILSPRALADLATLPVPVTFTTLTVSGVPEEDPLAWLD